MCSGLEIKKLKSTINCDFNKLCLYFSIYTAGILCICHMSSHGLWLDARYLSWFTDSLQQP